MKEVTYSSTRGDGAGFTASMAILKGLAADGATLHRGGVRVVQADTAIDSVSHVLFSFKKGGKIKESSNCKQQGKPSHV